MSEGVTPPQLGPNPALLSRFQSTPRCHQDGETLRKGIPEPRRWLTAEEPLGPELDSPARASAWARAAFPPGERPAPGPRAKVRLRGVARHRWPLPAASARPGAQVWTTSPPPGPTRPPSHPAPHGHCLRSAARGLGGGLVSRAARSPLRRPLLGCSAPTDLPRRRLGRRGPGLAAGVGGGASRPSDHLWKRAAGRGGGCLLVQLQPTRRSRFGGPRLPASARSPPQPPAPAPAAGGPRPRVSPARLARSRPSHRPLRDKPRVPS